MTYIWPPFLLATFAVSTPKSSPNIENLSKRAAQIFRDKIHPATFERDTIDNLISKRLLKQEGGNFLLASSGLTFATQARKRFLDHTFSDYLIRTCESNAYSLFCERVYGKNLYQFNMMTMSQLTKLLNILKLSSGDRVLDLGCGMGKITEYIADVTHASLIGVDIASKAIKCAQNRTQENSADIEFWMADMDDLTVLKTSVDCIIAIDVLYYVEDLNTTVGQMKRILKQQGQMGIFFSQSCKLNESTEILHPDKTKLGLSLKNHGLNFQTYEFTESEREFWTRSKQVIAELERDFLEEGNMELYEDTYEEIVGTLKACEDGRRRRYLYHITI